MGEFLKNYKRIILCSFCLRKGFNLSTIISGQNSFICLNCILICFKVFLNYNSEIKKTKNILYKKKIKKSIFNNIYLDKYLKFFTNFNKNKFINYLIIKKKNNFLMSNNFYNYNYEKNFYNFNVETNIIENKEDYLNFNWGNNFIYKDYYNSINIINYIEVIINFSETYTGFKLNYPTFLSDFDWITNHNQNKYEFIIDFIINFKDDYIYVCKDFYFTRKIISNFEIEEYNKIKNNSKIIKKTKSEEVTFKFENRIKSICNKNTNFSYNNDFKDLFFNERYYNFDNKYFSNNFDSLNDFDDIFNENVYIFKEVLNIEYDDVLDNYYIDIFDLYHNPYFYINFYNFNVYPYLDLCNDFENYYNFDINLIKNIEIYHENKYYYYFNKFYNFNLSIYIGKIKIYPENDNEDIFDFKYNFGENFDGYFNLDLNSPLENLTDEERKYTFKNNWGDDLIFDIKDEHSFNCYLNKNFRNRDLYKKRINILKKRKNSFLKGLPTPKDFKEYLDKYIMGQISAKETLSVSIYNHFKRLKFNLMYGYNLPKSNILLIGPSGSGKTYIMQTLSKILNIPFIIADATTLTEAGYVGEDVESIIQRLFQESNFDIEKTEMGIIYIDEIDKISKKNSENSGGGRDISGEGVQQALLKLIEGTICPVCFTNNRKNFNQNFVNINTENILFICGGAFFNLEKIISEKENKISIGFSNYDIKKKSKDKTNLLDPEDLVKFGLIPELIGRLPVIARLNELNIEILIKILKDPNSSVISYYNILLSPEDIKLTIDDDAIEIIAKMAYKRKTGARGLRGIIDNILSNVLFEAPDIDTLREIIIHKYVFEGDLRTPLLVHYD